jgi:alkanesulfonate monooxygenase SsuD/methylene tetrahydromethanopterin reductase-like flavin-dependent oxidoreductase (luciferase family)
MGGGTPDQFADAVQQLQAAWSEHSRDGRPRKMALAYFSLGDDAERNANHYLLDYYAFLGEELSAMIARSAAKDADTVKAYVAAFENAGCDELVLFPCAADSVQVELLAAALGR